MGENYYLKSSRDEFKKHYIKLIRHRHFGNDFYALYSVMLHESIDHNGELRNSDVLPFDEDSLSMVAFGDCIVGPRDIKHFVGIVHEGLILFRELGLIETREDGTIIMLKLADKIGTTSTVRSQRFRAKHGSENTKKRVEGNANETKCNVAETLQPVAHGDEKCNDNDLLKSLELRDKSKDLKKDEPPVSEPSIDYSQITEYWNEKMADKQIPKTIKKMSGSRKQHLTARIADHGLEKVFMMIDMASKSNFLNGDNERGWTANFDWCLNPTNYTKIIEGNYANKGGSGNGQTGKPTAKDEFHGHGTTV